MRQDLIEFHELLYRAVPNKPSHWITAEDRPSTAIFKDKRGVSVDRDGGRPENAIVRLFEQRKPGFGLVAVTGQECVDCEAYPKPDRLEDNEYHALILRSKEVVQLTRRQMRCLQAITAKNIITKPR